MRARALEILCYLLVFALAAWQFDGLGAGLGAPIPHGPDEDWDWQLTIWEAGRRSAQLGQLPGWNPWTAGGMPLFAHPEAPFLYPPWWLSLVFDTELAIKLLVLFHLGLLTVGAGLAGRELGLPTYLVHLGTLFVLCSAFLPEFIAFGHVMFVAVGWLPLAWVALRRGRWGLSGVALAMPALAGGHYLFLYGVLWLTLDALGRALRPERARWLCAALLLNGLALGVDALAWPIGVALAAAALAQRPVQGATPRPLLGALSVAGLLVLPKLAPMLVFLGRSARLSAAPALSVADPYTTLELARVLSGFVPRPSGHEGPNVFFSPIPAILGLLGLAVVGWRRPAWGLVGWVFWSLGWGGATPVNLLSALHRLPGFELLRVIERYSLVWTLFLGWGAGALLAALWRRSRLLALALGLVLAAGLLPGMKQAALLQRLGPGPPAAIAAGPFAQVRDETSNFHGVLANHGRPDRTTSVGPGAPAAGLRVVGEPDYKGEAWLLETWEPLELAFSPNVLGVTLPRAGTVVINQNAWPGWSVDRGEVRSQDGLLAVAGEAGPLELRYRPPWLGGASAVSLGGLALLALAGRRRTSASTPPSSHS